MSRSLWLRLNVRAKLFLILAIILGLFIAQIATSLIVGRREDRAIENLLASQAEIQLAKNLQVETQLIRYYESAAALQVLLDGPTGFVDDHAVASEHVVTALDITAELQQNLPESGIVDDARLQHEQDVMTEVQDLMTAHQSGLAEFSDDLLPNRGDQVSGRVGDMVAPLTTLNQSIDASIALDYALQYGLRLNPTASLKMPGSLGALLKTINESDLPPARQDELRGLVESARTGYFNLLAYDLTMQTKLETLSGQTVTINELLDDFISAKIEENAGFQQRFDSAKRLKQNSQYVTAIAAVLIGSLLSFLLAREITQPIESLRRTTQQIAKGDYSIRSRVTRTDEFGILADSFNQMAQTIEKRDSEIREQSKSLENALEHTEETSRLKSEFLSVMSHELRTPLNSILGFTGILLMGIRGELDERVADAVRHIEGSGEHLLTLINEILDLSKIEAGRLEITSAPIEVPTLLNIWQSRAQVLADKKNIVLKVERDPDFPKHILGDSERLTQIASNLLSNAMKFTDQGSVILNVHQNGNQKWCIEVTDTGIGISPEACEFIFDEFRQVDGSSTRSAGGTGLGLAIVRRIAEAMDGNVQVRSQIGVGSTFTVTLPLIPVETTEKSGAMHVN